MSTRDKRFEVVYSQGVTDIIRIIQDNVTGVQYLQVANGYSGGITPLLDKNGASVVWEVPDTGGAER